MNPMKKRVGGISGFKSDDLSNFAFGKGKIGGGEGASWKTPTGPLRGWGWRREEEVEE